MIFQLPVRSGAAELSDISVCFGFVEAASSAFVTCWTGAGVPDEVPALVSAGRLAGAVATGAGEAVPPNLYNKIVPAATRSIARPAMINPVLNEDFGGGPYDAGMGVTGRGASLLLTSVTSSSSSSSAGAVICGSGMEN